MSKQRASARIRPKLRRVKQKQRRIYRVRWNPHHEVWTCWSRIKGENYVHVSTSARKYEVLSDAKRDARAHWVRGGLAQLVVRGRNGRIQYEHTYGADPRRRRG